MKPNCTLLLLDAIWEIVTDRATATDKHEHIKAMITGCKTKLAMTFMVGTKKQYLHITCGDDIGNGMIKDLLDHTVDKTTDEYIIIEFHINKLYFIPGFMPEDLKGMPSYRSSLRLQLLQLLLGLQPLLLELELDHLHLLRTLPL